MTPTDALIREIEGLRAALDATTGRASVSIHAVLERDKVTVTAKVKQIAERRQ